MTAYSIFQIAARFHVFPFRFLAEQDVAVKHAIVGNIGARGFEPPTSWSQTTRSTKLSYAPATVSYHDRRRIAFEISKCDLATLRNFRGDQYHIF
jgi:hypothetical protein